MVTTTAEGRPPAAANRARQGAHGCAVHTGGMSVESELLELVMGDDAAASAYVRRLVDPADRPLAGVDLVVPVQGLPPLY